MKHRGKKTEKKKRTESLADAEKCLNKWWMTNFFPNFMKSKKLQTEKLNESQAHTHTEKP